MTRRRSGQAASRRNAGRGDSRRVTGVGRVRHDRDRSRRGAGSRGASSLRRGSGRGRIRCPSRGRHRRRGSSIRDRARRLRVRIVWRSSGSLFLSTRQNPFASPLGCGWSHDRRIVRSSGEFRPNTHASTASAVTRAQMRSWSVENQRVRHACGIGSNDDTIHSGLAICVGKLRPSPNGAKERIERSLLGTGSGTSLA